MDGPCIINEIFLKIIDDKNFSIRLRRWILTQGLIISQQKVDKPLMFQAIHLGPRFHRRMDGKEDWFEGPGRSNEGWIVDDSFSFVLWEQIVYLFRKWAN